MSEPGRRRIIRPTETERFSHASGPVKILMREGKMLQVPEFVYVSADEPMTDPYSERRRRLEQEK